jgi:oligopeptide/dipeptide ABC transporter ATP-binding protein
LFITHNLGIVAQTADRVAVMYAGLMVEEAPTPELFRRPDHPYTQGLLASVPRLDFRHPPGEILSAIKGHLPAEPPPGCLFRDRCPLAHGRCLEEPPWVEVSPGHRVRCWNYVWKSFTIINILRYQSDFSLLFKKIGSGCFLALTIPLFLVTLFATNWQTNKKGGEKAMMTIQEAAYKILEEAGKPLTSKEIAVIALNKHMVISNAKDPPFSLASTIDKNIRDGIYNKPRLKFDHTPQGRKIRLPSWELNPPASSGPPFGTIGYVELKAKIPSDLFEKDRKSVV